MLPKSVRFVKLKLQRQIQRELNPRKIALAISWGTFLGIIPFFCGVNIVLGLLICSVCRLNHIIVQLVSNIIYPLQILLFLPFIKLGVTLFSSEKVELSGQTILQTFQHSPCEGVMMLGAWNLYALLAWILTAAPLSMGLYFVLNRTIVKKRKPLVTVSLS